MLRPAAEARRATRMRLPQRGAVSINVVTPRARWLHDQPGPPTVLDAASIFAVGDLSKEMRPPSPGQRTIIERGVVPPQPLPPISRPTRSAGGPADSSACAGPRSRNHAGISGRGRRFAGPFACGGKSGAARRPSSALQEDGRPPGAGRRRVPRGRYLSRLWQRAKSAAVLQRGGGERGVAAVESTTTRAGNARRGPPRGPAWSGTDSDGASKPHELHAVRAAAPSGRNSTQRITPAIERLEKT